VGQFSCICTSGWEGQRCSVDSDECVSGPCLNSGTCIESTDSVTVPVDSYVCRCGSGWNGTRCARDINECMSHPCRNGAACTDSTSLPSVSVGQFSCTCDAGFTNTICDGDVDECASTPCENGATCTDSSANSSVPVDAYSCSCAEGFANGMCAYAYVEGYAASCSVQLGGHCEVDVNECTSQPCRNDGVCSESGNATSIPAHAYQCSCAAGYANGLCAYAFIGQYSGVNIPTPSVLLFTPLDLQ
jgi:hypothetical protein